MTRPFSDPGTCAIVTLACLAAAGCAPDNAPSHSSAELERQVTADVPAAGVTWQIFGTPEYTGGLPAPTDYMTLIAEYRGVPAQGLQAETHPSAGYGWRPKRSARGLRPVSGSCWPPRRAMSST